MAIAVADIAFFFATHKLVCLVTQDGIKFILDESLAEIERVLDTPLFLANCKNLAHRKAVQKAVALPKSRLLLQLAPAPPVKWW